MWNILLDTFLWIIANSIDLLASLPVILATLLQLIATLHVLLAIFTFNRQFIFILATPHVILVTFTHLRKKHAPVS